MRTKIAYGIFIFFMTAFVVSCSQSDKGNTTGLTARLYAPDKAIVACDSALNQYAVSVRGDYTFEGLKDVFEQYIEEYPNSTQIQRYFQSIFPRFGKEDELRERYKKEYEEHPNSAMYTYLYSRVLEASKQLELTRKVTELDPNYYWGWYSLAVVLSHEPYNDTSAAIKNYLKAIAIDNSQPNPFQSLGQIYKDLGNLDSALVYFDLLSQTQPDNISSLSPKIRVLMDMDRSEEAEKEIKTFVDKHPNDNYALLELIDTYDNLGKYAETIPLLYRLLNMARSPNDPYYRLMITYCKMNQPDSAFAILQRAKDSGYDDYRPLLYDPELEPMRHVAGFEEMKKLLLAGLDTQKSQQEKQRAEGQDERKKAALEDKLEKPAPDFSFVDLYGNTITLSELRGNIVILDFWATWCGPCRLTMPLMDEFHNARKNDMKYYAVNVWENDTSLVRPYLKKYGYSFNNLFGSTKTASDFGVKGIPSLFVIDKEGVIRYVHIGYNPNIDEVLSWQLDDLLKQ